MDYNHYLRIKEESNRRASEIVPTWLLGKKEGDHWVAKNPTRADKNAGSFKINLKTGQWIDFATGDCGGCVISLAIYLHGDRTPYEAAANIARMIGIRP